MKPTKEMFKLGQVVFLEGLDKLKECKKEQENWIYKRSELIIKKRLAVVEITHGIELIFKAIMIKKGYIIHKLKYKIIKENVKIKDIVDEKRTIDLIDIINFFKKEYPHLKFDSIDELRELRNQIIHKGTDIGEKRKVYFVHAIQLLIILYRRMGLRHKKFLDEIRLAIDQI